jgi:hypothetical protein
LWGGALPVYAPTTQNALGEYVAKVGGAEWVGTGSGALTVSKKSGDSAIFKPNGFNIKDNTQFPTQSNDIGKGEFVRGFAGYDEAGNSVEAVLYRGVDGKFYSVDDKTMESFSSDPLLSNKLNGYVKRMSPSEMRVLSQQAQPMGEGFAGREGRVANAQSNLSVAQGEKSRLQSLGFFGQVKEGLKQMGENPSMSEGATDAITEGVRAGVRSNPVGKVIDTLSPVTSFFTDRINNPNKPDQPSGQSGFMQRASEIFRKQS